MIHNICLQNFKCFRQKQNIPLSPITIMYGKNGRGKSSIAQALLLIGQTMRANNSIEVLSFMGDFVKLGNFDEVISNNSVGNEIAITLTTDKEELEMGFSSYSEKPQLARLSTFIINGQNRLETKTSNVDKSNNLADNKTDTKSVSTTSDIKILQELKSISVISASRIGPINSAMRNDSLSSNWLGINGENLINVLANQGEDFIKQLESYLSNILSGAAIRIENPGKDIIELLLNSVDGTTCFRPINVGFGYSYVLPVIVGALLAEKGSILVIENPEAHLHPGAQSRLTNFLISIAKTRNLQILIETHSDHVINGMRIAMKNSTLKPSDAQIIHIAHENNEPDPIIDIITCDQNGVLSNYPDDFMDEWTLQLLQLV